MAKIRTRDKIKAPRRDLQPSDIPQSLVAPFLQPINFDPITSPIVYQESLYSLMLDEEAVEVLLLAGA